MGAPGNALFCKNGHLVHWINEHLYWTDEMFDELAAIEKAPCPFCGEPIVANISHYGNINDCGEEILPIGYDEFYVHVKIPVFLKDKDGEMVEYHENGLFRKQKVVKYDISKVKYSPGR